MKITIFFGLIISEYISGDLVLLKLNGELANAKDIIIEMRLQTSRQNSLVGRVEDSGIEGQEFESLQE